MVAVWIIIVLVVLGISLYNYFDMRDQTTLSMLFEQRNRRYGAYALRNNYGRVMVVILSGTIVLFGATLSTQYTFFSGGDIPESLNPPKHASDTLLLTLDTPPKDANATLPPSVTIKSDRGSGGNAAADQEAQESSEAESSATEPETNSNSDKLTPTDQSPKPKKEKKPKSNDKEIDEGAAQIERQMEDARRRNAEHELKKKQREEQAAMRKAGNNQNSSKGNESTKKPESAAEFDLAGRTPFENDKWYLNYPSFTCYNGGTVVVKIKVDGGGNVIAAEAMNAENMDDCIKRNAEKYARKARFNASSKAIQEGTLTYRFKAQ